MVENNVILEAKALTKVYGTVIKNEVLHQLDFNINENEFTSIIGYSGSGKSTLLNLIGTLDRPSSGDLYYKGISVSDMNRKELAEFRNRNIGFIFQFHHLLPAFTALENVLIPTWIKTGKATDRHVSSAKDLLDLVGLGDFMDKKTSNLSGGQQQRVAIARSLINEPALLLGDEPTGNLDSETTDQIYGLFRKINKDLGTTMIIVTHNDHIAAKSDRVIELTDGNISRDYMNSSLSDEEAFQSVAPVYCRLCGHQRVQRSNL